MRSVSVSHLVKNIGSLIVLSFFRVRKIAPKFTHFTAKEPNTFDANDLQKSSGKNQISNTTNYVQFGSNQ